jgi:putative salt-induced outer membrane protein YdiY
MAGTEQDTRLRADHRSGLGLALALSAAVACTPPAALAAKTDVLVLRNGDRITGEVKGLARGKLDYSTDDAGRLSVEWDKVARLTSPHSFDVEDAAGVRYFGRLVPAGRDGFVVFQDVGSDTLPVVSVIGITPVNAAFVERLSAYLDLGFTLAKANQATTFSVSGQANYRAPSMDSQFSYDAYAQGQESVPTTTRNTVSQSVSWLLQHRWSLVGLAQFEQNDELDLDHRVTAGGGIQRTLQQSNQMKLSAGAGLVVTQEQFSSGASAEQNTSLEGLLAADWDIFRFDSPKLDFSTTLALFPSISQTGRVRGQSGFRVVYELFKDFNVGIRLTDTFDSRPPEGASRNDYVTGLTIGWSYRR